MKSFSGGVIGLVIGIIIGALFGPMVMGSIFNTTTESRDSQLMNAVTREGQIVLVSLGIQGLHNQDANSQLFGLDIPWSDRTSILEYSFLAKLGIDGGEVTIEQTGVDSFLLTIPDFIFIGHQDESYRIAFHDHGLLSWLTPGADAADLITDILNDEGVKQQYIDANVAVLREQAIAFYEGIISSVAPEVEVEFQFTQRVR